MEIMKFKLKHMQTVFRIHKQLDGSRGYIFIRLHPIPIP